ncbi:MAG: HEAT repeat domain-containing protein [Acidobacteria bacterium]|nr:HEAT repeat domain-containing protein [Acidobacteriota bacterium]
MYQTLLVRMLKPFGQIRQKEALTAFLMFFYSLLVVAAYTVIEPVTRSKFMASLGPDNLPYVELVTGTLIGFIMAAYSWAMARLSRRWCLGIAQCAIAVVLLIFWFLFRTEQTWVVSAAFYLAGRVLGILLISQFWTLANAVFDPRQAKRLFGFIGGGSSLGGIIGSALAKKYAVQIGTENLLLFSVGFLVLSIVVSGLIVRREKIGEEMQGIEAGMEKVGSGREVFQLLRKSRQLRLIALVIGLAAIGTATIELQLNLATAEAKGSQSTDAITTFLANVGLWTSIIGFLVQVLLTSRIHQHLGIGFALLMLPVSLGSTASVILFNPTLWAPGLARVLDRSLGYTIDKTTREVLYTPLTSGMQFSAKPFIDVTIDRFAKGLGAVLLLFLIKPWGLALTWQRLSYASIIIACVWIFVALRARLGHKDAFRKSLNTRDIKPEEVTEAVADVSTIETLIQELASSDEQRVLYAIEFLESIGKKHLVTPLLLYHESPTVRARALSVMSSAMPEISSRWLPAINGMMTDPDPNVRAEAVGALARMHNRQASDLVRPLMQDGNPRISLTAAMMLAGSGNEEDAVKAEDVLNGLVSDTRDSAVPVRRDFAVAIRHVSIPHFRRLLIPLLNDPNPEVAEEAMRSMRKLGATDFMFVPTLISLLRNRRQKSSARELLVGFGERVLPILAHFLRDPGEDLWIRRHIPETIARIPCQKAMNILVEALEEKDGFLRFHVISALERIHRIKPELSFDMRRIEALIQGESTRYREYRRLHQILFDLRGYPKDSLLSRAMAEKMKRGLDRIYRLLSLLYPWRDIVAARHSMEHGDTRSRAGTLEYLDNLLVGDHRKILIPILEDMLSGEGVPMLNGTESNTINVMLRLINDEDPVVASAAIYFIWQQRLPNFEGEIERILATGDTRDRQVLETASWVLRELHTPAAKKRLLWLDPLPSVDLADQMRCLPIFGSVTVDEIFRICETGRQVRSEAGRLLCKEALVPETVQFLLNGRVIITRANGEARQIEAPAVLAFQEVLEERPMVASVRSADISVCLTLTSEEIRTMLVDNSNLIQGLFQMLCRDSRSGQVVVKGSPLPLSALPADGSLNPIEKGLVLKAIPVFSMVSPEEMIALASMTTETRMNAGSDFVSEGDRPAIYVVVSGQLSIKEGAGPPVIAESSDVIGIYETLAGFDFGFRAHVNRSGIALRVSHEDLFDLLMHRSALLRQIFGALFRNQRATSAAAEAFGRSG